MKIWLSRDDGVEPEATESTEGNWRSEVTALLHFVGLLSWSLTATRLIPQNCTLYNMALFGRDKARERFYLLPGMGGSNLRRKRKRILGWSIAAGLLVTVAVQP